jgi:hypothetical protein
VARVAVKSVRLGGVLLHDRDQAQFIVAHVLIATLF